MSKQPIYAPIIEKIFRSRFRPGMREVNFEREEITSVGKKLGINLPKNYGDLVYSFRYRRAFPETIQSTAGKGETWIIRPAGRSRYRFVLVPDKPLIPNQGDYTPEERDIMLGDRTCDVYLNDVA